MVLKAVEEKKHPRTVHAVVWLCVYLVFSMYTQICRMRWRLHRRECDRRRHCSRRGGRRRRRRRRIRYNAVVAAVLVC